MEPRSESLRNLPRIDALLAAGDDLVERYGREPAAAALRDAVAHFRARMLDGGDAPTEADVVYAAREALAAGFSGPPRPVLNATGVLIHTNLGRAPLSAAAMDAMLDAAGYCDVEYDLAAGERGSRTAHLQGPLAAATGAPAGLAVNNAAAALVLALASLAHGRQVLVSRGELVEIGGGEREQAAA